MLSDDKIKLEGRSAFGIDPTFDGNLMRFARAVEREERGEPESSGESAQDDALDADALDE